MSRKWKKDWERQGNALVRKPRKPVDADVLTPSQNAASALIAVVFAAGLFFGWQQLTSAPVQPVAFVGGVPVPPPPPISLQDLEREAQAYMEAAR